MSAWKIAVKEQNIAESNSQTRSNCTMLKLPEGHYVNPGMIDGYGLDMFPRLQKSVAIGPTATLTRSFLPTTSKWNVMSLQHHHRRYNMQPADVCNNTS